MPESRDYLEMTFRSINAFANDGTLDAEELGELVEIALRDGHIDANEKRVLENVLSRLNDEDLNDELSESVEELKKILQHF